MDYKKRTFLFLAIVIGSVLINPTFFRQLLSFSLENDFSSHILIVPLISVVLILRQRTRIFADVGSSIACGASVFTVGTFCFLWLTFNTTGLHSQDILSAKTAAVVLMWLGAFLFFYGFTSFRKALFPLLFLLLVIPFPQRLLEFATVSLQRGSAEITAFLFKITGTPYYRDSFYFKLPHITIEIAKECSGIRSSLALLISGLLAAHLMLQSTWRKSILVAYIIPLAMFKNAVRIVTLSLLSIHIDTRFLINSDLHSNGGILFFLLALVMMLPVLWLLRRTEQKQA